ncbi:methyl-accepting chemotaxis protein [Sporomusaceae bacterium BoRhaA]|uniref:hypothetical protein n=1 Tax=Pelorhabdus rhamnosifermentans TaxID=2772457 RepID=UPI001C0648D5|nr:hypothetical protein [Pelorhabdus rhamnosifermentans]MBU2700434.1 methyl-accepting chemotaxis protein [Pelorhabdus rhamnosifermentans]
MDEINAVMTYGAGAVALAFVFKLLWDYQTNLSKSMKLLSKAVDNNTQVTVETSHAMERISESLQHHDNRAQEMKVKIEGLADNVESKLKESCNSNQVIRDKVVEIAANLK